MRPETICIDKAILEKFGGDLKITVLFIVMGILTKMGQEVYEGTEEQIIEASLGLLGVPSLRRATKKLISLGYIERKKVFAAKPQWRFYPLGQKRKSPFIKSAQGAR